ncbi:MAG TPA: macro domain-containing protein [Bryobacteraceae bacterium]|jgi:O-acetyl-ADP-ribose deacetylase (regulator of RNase III)
MIEYKTGDILAEPAEALVNTVNCVGIMGRGIALQFKNAFPDNFKAYEQACDRHEVQPGRMFVFETHNLNGLRYIINFPTKRHWRGKSRMEDIEAGLKALVTEIKSRDIHSIAIPPLGSGLGGLDWTDVSPRIEHALGGIEDLKVIVYEPKGAPDPRDMISSRAVPKMTPGKAALIVLMDRYLGGLLDPFVTLLEVHKLMYFMQEAGEKLRLQYVKAPYGPYADNLRHVLKQIEGHFISGYADGGDAPTKRLELVPGAVEDANAFLAEAEGVRQRFERVGDLVQGFETPFGLELLSTVHWVVTRNGAASDDEVIEQTYSWNERKRQFTKHQIRLALHVLVTKDWIAPDFPVTVDRTASLQGSIS